MSDCQLLLGRGGGENGEKMWERMALCFDSILSLTKTHTAITSDWQLLLEGVVARIQGPVTFFCLRWCVWVEIFMVRILTVQHCFCCKT